MTEAELKLRTKEFALRALKMIDALPRTVSGRIVANQLGRCATSVASNYRAACRGRSRAEFIAKLGVVEEEADESAFWIDFARDAGLISSRKVAKLYEESMQLTAIMCASRITAARKRRSIENQKSKIENP